MVLYKVIKKSRENQVEEKGYIFMVTKICETLKRKK